MERIVSTRMPFQYLHMVNFLLFIFVFSAPFVFTTGFKWLSPIPSCIVAISFYGVAEVGRSIEDPYSWAGRTRNVSGDVTLARYCEITKEELGVRIDPARFKGRYCRAFKRVNVKLNLSLVDRHSVTLTQRTALQDVFFFFLFYTYRYAAFGKVRRYYQAKPCHDLTGVGWRLYLESLQLHEASVADIDAAAANADEANGHYHDAAVTDSSAGAAKFRAAVDTITAATKVVDANHVRGGLFSGSVKAMIGLGSLPAKVTIEPTISVRQSVAHGPVDVILLSSQLPSAKASTVAAVQRAMDTAAAEASPMSGDVGVQAKHVLEHDSTSIFMLPLRVRFNARRASTMAPTALHHRAELAKHRPPELSDLWYGFFTDIFRFRDTIHREVIPQVLLAFVIGLAAQGMKIWRCGGNVQEAFECPVTFDVHAHQVMGSALAFMIVYRFKFAYDRYFEAKTAIGELHCGLRNFNIGVCAFLRDSREGEPGYDASDAEALRDKTALLLRERTELLRLSGMLYGFLRHVLREQRLGYPDDPSPGDKQLLMQDTYGKPSLGSLLRDAKEIAEFSKVPFQNRPNMVVTRMQSIVEHHRRLGHICDRGAFDLYAECERVLSALKTCERIVTTPIPFQYIQMCNFVTFFFTYSAPFIFTVSYQYISFFPACLLAMAFYGINVIGEVIERPFNWQEPNHDLTGVGLRIWRECVQIHRRCADRDAVIIDGAGAGHGRGLDRDGAYGASTDGGLNELASRASNRPDYERLLQQHQELQHTFRRRRSSAVDMAAALASEEYPRDTFSFFTGLFTGRNSVMRKVAPQCVLAALGGVFAQTAKLVMCGDFIKRSSECNVTFHTEMHAICGAIIGFLLVFCANIAYMKFYEAKSAIGDVYHGIRNMNIAFASFLRAPVQGEPGHANYKGKGKNGGIQIVPGSSAASIRNDQLELRRLTNILFAFMRQALREQRHGYSSDHRQTRTPSHPDIGPAAAAATAIAATSKSVFGGVFGGIFGGVFGKSYKMNKRKSVDPGGGTGPVSDGNLLSEDLCGEPTLSVLLSADERRRYASADYSNRFNIVVTEIQRIVEKNRRNGDVYEKAAFDIYRDCDAVLAAYKTCERIVTTPIPYQYVHMVNLVLFFFVFSAPFIFTVTFKWITPFPSAILALGFYGIWEVGKTMMDPFDWNEPRIDLTAVGRRINSEAQRITEAGQHRYSIFSHELNSFVHHGSGSAGGGNFDGAIHSDVSGDGSGDVNGGYGGTTQRGRDGRVAADDHDVTSASGDGGDPSGDHLSKRFQVSPPGVVPC